MGGGDRMVDAADLSELKEKMIVVDNCLVCPRWGECKPSKKLQNKERLFLTCGVGIGKFILEDCPLPDATLQER